MKQRNVPNNRIVASLMLVLAFSACNTEDPVIFSGNNAADNAANSTVEETPDTPVVTNDPVDTPPDWPIPQTNIEQICTAEEQPTTTFDTIPCTDHATGAAGWTAFAEMDEPTDISTTTDAVSGDSAIFVDTQAAFAFHVRYDAPTVIDISDDDLVQFAVKARNTSQVGWQGNFPVIRLEDGTGSQIELTPDRVHLPTDGATWTLIEAPVAGNGGTWVRTGSANLSDIRAIEIEMDTWDAGFQLTLDALSFKPFNRACDVRCPGGGCGDRGLCDPIRLECACDTGSAGPQCGSCAEGFVEEDGSCVEPGGGEPTLTYWPNEESRANSDAWLRQNHAFIQNMYPKVLVLNFANPSTPDHTDQLVDRVIEGFTEGSRPLGYRHAEVPPQLEYQVVKTVDLRDGVDGRPEAPDDWRFDNSTLMPRRVPEEEGYWRFDYKQLFNEEFAEHYGFQDPDTGESLDLCELFEQGLVNEVWFLASGDVADDVNAAEVLEFKQRYGSDGEPIEGEFDRCAGNGCFDADVPSCDVSVKIGNINYNRGPGCYLHSQGHGLESASRSNAVPDLRRWFMRFAAFDLDERYDVPFKSLYEVSCNLDQCIRVEDETVIINHQGEEYRLDEPDFGCGNVHFPPNGTSHYDYGNEVEIPSSCGDYGRHSLACGEYETENVNRENWSAFEELSPDCGGAFLVWWFQNMPQWGSEQYFEDHRPMKSVWPYLFY